MKIIKILLLILFIYACGNGQYNPEVQEYRLKIYRIGVVPDLIGFESYTFYGDTTIQLAWEHNENTEPYWYSPYVRTLHSTLIIPNEEGLWGIWEGGVLVVGTDTTAYKTRTLTLDTNNWYEVTMTAYYIDTYDPRESMECRPFYIHVVPIPNKPWIIINLRLNE